MAITIVQQTSKATAGTATTVTTDAPGVAWTAGALLICCFRRAVVSSVTGGGCSGGWTLARADTNINAFSAEIWYGYNVGGGSQAVTVNYASASDTEVNVTELAGAASSGDPTNGVNGSSGLNGTSINSGNVTPTASTEVIIFNCGGLQANTTAVAGPSGWTSLTGGAPNTTKPASYKIISSASGSYNATYGIGYNRFAVSIAVFKAGGGGGGSASPYYLSYYSRLVNGVMD